MRLLGSIMDKLVSVGVIGLIILFQEEIRRFLYQLGAHQRFQALSKFFTANHENGEEDKETIVPIVLSCMSMAKGRVGALIVIERSVSLGEIVETGDFIDARVNHGSLKTFSLKIHLCMMAQ